MHLYTSFRFKLIVYFYYSYNYYYYQIKSDLNGFTPRSYVTKKKKNRIGFILIIQYSHEYNLKSCIIAIIWCVFKIFSIGCIMKKKNAMYLDTTAVDFRWLF